MKSEPEDILILLYYILFRVKDTSRFWIIH